MLHLIKQILMIFKEWNRWIYKKQACTIYYLRFILYKRCILSFMVKGKCELRRSWAAPSIVLLRAAEWCLVMLRTQSVCAHECMCCSKAGDFIVEEVFENVNTRSLRPSSKLWYLHERKKGSEWVSVITWKHWIMVCSSFRSLCSIVLNLNSLDQQITSKGVLCRL